MWNFWRNKKFLNKKVLIGLVFVLILAIAGVFYYRQANKEMIGLPSDYVIQDTGDGKIVKNEKAGLTVKVPDGWEVENLIFGEGAVNLYSQDANIEKNDGRIILPLNNGCLIQLTINYNKLSFDQIEKEARETHFLMGATYDEFEKITINNNKALKNNFFTKEMGASTAIYIPIVNKIYSFYLVYLPEDQEYCVQKFNEFLETISIK